MKFHKRLRKFFEDRNITNREISKKINYSEVMVSRYLNVSKPNYEFLNAIITAFPEIDLNHLFKDNIEEHLAEGGSAYAKDEVVLIDEIEVRLHFLKEVLTQKRHE